MDFRAGARSQLQWHVRMQIMANTNRVMIQPQINAFTGFSADNLGFEQHLCSVSVCTLCNVYAIQTRASVKNTERFLRSAHCFSIQ